MPDYTYCDDDALHAESTRASSLTPNQFHKLCPGTHVNFSDGTYSAFGQPRCGDGSNFAFFYSPPLKQLENKKKIIIEFQGGGACWDEDTCGKQKDYLAYPEYFDKFIGLSCSEIEYGAAVQGGNPLSLLCAKQIGSTDFREYNTIVVPYCTQDVHIGDAPNFSYDDGSTVHHVGAHNMLRTLKWVFTNFPNPTHIFLTGCSAGGTAVPIAYDLIHKHYNTFPNGGPRAVNINAIMDSSVYLTPSYFLANGFPNWNPGSIMSSKLGFNYNKYKYDTIYPDLVWDHVLRRGSNFDQWGFVTHSTDPVSLMFYQYMSGNGGDEGGRSLSANPYSPSIIAEGDSRRRTDNDLQSQWWQEISNSMALVKKKHHNVDSYIIDGEGHCSFGLYYPLQEEGFEEWAAPIVKERIVIGNRSPSVGAFVTSLACAGILVLLTRRLSRKDSKKAALMDNDGADLSYMGETAATLSKRVRLGYCMEKLDAIARPVVTKCKSWPWTAGYLLATTTYFLGMLMSQGFAHPLDNPGFGPSAVGLSTFGINNPALVIYRMEHFRLISSSLLCSGVTTYIFVTYAMYKAGVETAMASRNHEHWHFLLVAAMISFWVNLLYACIGNGASCASLALALGLNSFSITMRRRSAEYPASWGFTIIVLILGCSPLFPFDSVVALVAAVVTGVVLGLSLFAEVHAATTSDPENVHHAGEELAKKPTQQVRWKVVNMMSVMYLLMYLLVLFRVPRPDELNVHPYLTGCGLVYSDSVGSFVNAYANGGGRSLQEGGDYFEGDNLCAQMCIPHLVLRPALWGAKKFAAVPLVQGTCENNGYETHIADKTFNEYSVVFEVQLFTSSNGDD